MDTIGDPGNDGPLSFGHTTATRRGGHTDDPVRDREPFGDLPVQKAADGELSAQTRSEIAIGHPGFPSRIGPEIRLFSGHAHMLPRPRVSRHHINRVISHAQGPAAAAGRQVTGPAQ